MRAAFLRPVAGAATLSVALLGLPVTTVGVPAVARPRPVSPHVVTTELASRVTTTAGDDVSGSLTRQSPWVHGVGHRSDRVQTLSLSGSMVALTWNHGATVAPDTAVAVRGRHADGSWGGWVPAQLSTDVDPSAAPSGVRLGTEPVWLGDFTAVQVRYPSSSTSVPRARLEVIDPGTSPADAAPAVPPSSATALAVKPVIKTRAEWGADESLRRGCVPTITGRTDGAVVHHDAGSNSYSASDSAAIVRAVYAYHTTSLGWCDIGYNVLIDKYGQAFEGRFGGLDKAVQGSHAYGYNVNTFGISMLGNYETATPTPAGLDILARVLAWKLDLVQLRGDATVTWTGSSGTNRGLLNKASTTFSGPVIIGHRDVNATACPGANLYSQLPAVRARVASLQSGFVDVAPADPFRMNIAWMANSGISTGWTVGGEAYYRPGDTVRRDAMAAFMYRLAGSPAFTPPATSPFADVATSHPFYREIAWLAARDISTGWVADGRRWYRPDETIARDAMAAFMYRLAPQLGARSLSKAYVPPSTSPFADVATTDAFYTEISWVAAVGVSRGWATTAGTEYRPLTDVGRDAMAAFMSRLAATRAQ
jgi:hypothetical protein